MNTIVSFAFIVTLASSGASDPKGLLADHPWEDGLYSTITAMSACRDGSSVQAQQVKLKVNGAKKKITGSAIFQPHRAPLIVILNGTFGRPMDSIGGLWASWLAEEGVHVFSFDSTFRADMTKASRHGVAGCLEAEAELSGRIIKAFLSDKRMQGKVSGIGVVGLSYGATQALILAKMDARKALPFRINAVRAFSPPISFARSIQLLDSYYDISNRAKDCRLTELYGDFGKIKRSYPVAQRHSAHRMKAAIGRVFRLDLEDVVDMNDRCFRKTFEGLRRAGRQVILLPDGDEDEDARAAAIEAVSFTQFVQGMVVPFWKAKGKVRSASEIFRIGELSALLPASDSNVVALVAKNDPLNAPNAWRSLNESENLVLIPRGGHLGYANSNWTRAQLSGLTADLSDPIWTQARKGLKGKAGSQVFASPRR